MLVNCNKPYVLKVDDVEWSPIGTRDGKDEYVVASSGFFEIWVDGIRVFFFRNEISADFNYAENHLVFLQGSSIVKRVVSQHGSYVQSSWSEPQGAFDNLIVRVFTQETETASALEVSCNNGDAVIASPETGSVRIQITNFDVNEYLMLKLGNVLLCFIAAD